jgi:hypothetical protein
VIVKSADGFSRRFSIYLCEPALLASVARALAGTIQQHTGDPRATRFRMEANEMRFDRHSWAGRSAALISLLLALVGVFVAPRAFARVTANTIDPVATVADHGRLLIVTGPIECTGSERAYLRVTVTQHATGAVAEGRTLVTCTGGIQQWEIHASAQGAETFEEGPATAAALARTAQSTRSDQKKAPDPQGGPGLSRTSRGGSQQAHPAGLSLR